MSTYVLPQVQVFQIFNQLPSSVIQNLNAFVFGPQYQLFRYGIAGEKSLTALGAYAPNTDTTYAWPSQPDGSIVDTSYAQLYMDNVWALYQTITTADQAQVPSEDHRNEIRVDNMVLATANGLTRSGTLYRDVVAGDTVRYSYTDMYDVTFTGTSKIVSLLADVEVATVGAAAPKASNGATQPGTANLATGTTAPFGYAADNTTQFASSKVFALDGVITDFPGSLSNGVEGDVVTVTVSTGGLAGTAQANIAYASGMYSADAVTIKAHAGYQGAIYLGNNLWLGFKTASAETTFAEGDIYTVTVSAPFTALTGSDVNTGGTFTGARNTTYQATVTRGGVFDRSVHVTSGLDNTISGTMALTVGPESPVVPSWAAWLGGDQDDEYLLVCTTGGAISAARFSLASQRGDSALNLNFASSAHIISIGNRGLAAAMTGTGTYTVGDYWAIRVNACRAQITVTDSAGIDAATVLTVTDTETYDVGNYGVTLNFDPNSNGDGGFAAHGGLLLGDVYYVPVTAVYSSGVHTMVLADDIDAGIPAGVDLSVWLYLVRNALTIASEQIQAPPNYNWTADPDTGIEIFAGIAIQDASWKDMSGVMPWLPVYQADMFMQYRALMTTNSSVIQLLQDISGVFNAVGTVHPDNPLAQGLYNALLNSGNRGVYYIGLPSNDMAGWSYCLSRASLTTDVYGLCPLTRDIDVIDEVIAHVDAMSSPTQKAWRIAFIGQDMPAETAIYNQAQNLDGVNYLCTITADPVTGKFTILNFVDENGAPSVVTKCLTDVRAGDHVKTVFATDAWGNETNVVYQVKSVVSNSRLKLVAGPASAVDVAAKVEVWHPYNIQETAEAVAARSTNLFNRRVYNCFPPSFSLGGVTQTAEFGAAMIAGLTSSVPPQQPLTNIQIVGIDDVPLVYRTFSRDQLNTIAGGGTLILMQDQPGGEVYVRHQISTAYSTGDLNQSELSMVKNFDSVSYYFAVRFAPYIGRYNVTPGILNLIYGILNDGIGYLGSLTNVGLLGPQIDLANTEIVGVQQSPIAKDTVIATVNLGLFAPFNVLQLQLIV